MSKKGPQLLWTGSIGTCWPLSGRELVIASDCIRFEQMFDTDIVFINHRNFSMHRLACQRC